MSVSLVKPLAGGDCKTVNSVKRLFANRVKHILWLSLCSQKQIQFNTRQAENTNVFYAVCNIRRFFVRFGFFALL